MNQLLERALDAHGGLKRWADIQAVETDLVSGGQLLDTKVGRTGDLMRVRASAHEQATTIGVDGSDKRGSFRPDRVAVETLEGETVIERLDPRDAYGNHDFETPWGVLDRGYFSGYAMWSYLTSPFSFTVEGTQVWDIDPLEEDGETWQGLRVVLPTNYATHSRAQDFYFGDDGLMRRQDYTLDIAGGLRVANYALDTVDVDGIKLASKRRAYMCNKRYEVLRDRLVISLDMSNMRAVSQ